MRLLEIRRAHPLNHPEPLVHTFAYQNVLFQITFDRSCCRAETPRAHPEIGARPYPRRLTEKKVTVLLSIRVPRRRERAQPHGARAQPAELEKCFAHAGMEYMDTHGEWACI